jgi:hypothetical protein
VFHVVKVFGPVLAAVALTVPAFAQTDGQILRDHLRKTYPSLAYVDRYRKAFPAEIQGGDALWKAETPPVLATGSDLAASLYGLQDQHVALIGPKMGANETLGVMFRTSTDGSMIVWRVLDAASPLKAGDVVLSIDGIATRTWLQKVAKVTFGGNRRSRAAEAALHFAAGNRGRHEAMGLGENVKLVIRRGKAKEALDIAYKRMGADGASLLAVAVNQPDLPQAFTSRGLKVGALRFGAFAPQFDETFNKASEAAEAVAGTSEDQAMVVGFCAVVRNFIAAADEAAARSDVLVLDLRGNMGGFDRLARLLAAPLVSEPIPATFYVLASGKPGVVTIKELAPDPSCGQMASPRPLIVLTDAGTRSAGELMAAWLWGAGAIVAGERTIGAGGGFEYGSSGFALPQSGYTVRASSNFTLFDGVHALKDGDVDEAAMVDTVAADRFAPSRTRYFAIQAAGMPPDVEIATTLDDLKDGGVGEVNRVIAKLQAMGKLPRPKRN